MIDWILEIHSAVGQAEKEAMDGHQQPTSNQMFDDAQAIQNITPFIEWDS